MYTCEDELDTFLPYHEIPNLLEEGIFGPKHPYEAVLCVINATKVVKRNVIQT